MLDDVAGNVCLPLEAGNCCRSDSEAGLDGPRDGRGGVGVAAPATANDSARGFGTAGVSISGKAW
jgi:hypothetical protein